jgi:hypothetical protein
VKADAFLLGAGLVEADVEDAAVASLVRDYARAFFRAGGTLSLSEWQRMSKETRAAFEEARRAFHVEQAQVITAFVVAASRQVQP